MGPRKSRISAQSSAASSASDCPRYCAPPSHATDKLYMSTHTWVGRDPVLDQHLCSSAELCATQQSVPCCLAWVITAPKGLTLHMQDHVATSHPAPGVSGTGHIACPAALGGPACRLWWVSQAERRGCGACLEEEEVPAVCALLAAARAPARPCRHPTIA